MNAPFQIPVAAPAKDPAAEAHRSVLIWDAPVRVMHWLLAFCVLGAFITAESERWRLVHATLGYTAGALAAFRVAWGFIGTRHARFGDFVRGPSAVLRYLGSLLSLRPESHAGHNPAGAVAVLVLLGMTLMAAISGHVVYEDLAAPWMEEVHEALGEFMMVVVGVHIAAVIVSGLLHRENLVRSMVDGRKIAPAVLGISKTHRLLAVLVVASVLGFWAIQRSDNAPAGAGAAPVAVSGAHSARPGSAHSR